VTGIDSISKPFGVGYKIDYIEIDGLGSVTNYDHNKITVEGDSVIVTCGDERTTYPKSMVIIHERRVY